MKLGISLLRANPTLWPTIATEAERLGFESVWVSEHLVMPMEIDERAYPEGELPITSRSPLMDSLVQLAYLAGVTTKLRLGTYVYQLGLRHPFIAARAIATLAVVSGGRLELGVGAGWLREEWQASGVEFDGRGRRLDEVLEVCRRLWTEDSVAHAGEFFSFPPVAFEPKPHPRPPVHVGGESAAALRRAVRHGDGWIGMHHDPESVRKPLQRVRALVEATGRAPLETTVAAHPGPDLDVAAWRRTEVDRLLVAPWQRTSGAIAGMRRFAANHLEP